ncbi:MAG: hypothetical protein GXY67_11945 [Clostridiales bacterium]|nr:hypothetical protein [Clostridiales bacterium]
MMNWVFALSEAAATTVVETAQANDFAGMAIMTKGLLTTGMGLLGVFLVLGLFFVTIRLMQRIKDKSGQD